VKSDVEDYAKTRNHRKTLQKMQKNNNLLKTKLIVNTKTLVRWGPGFYVSLPEGGSHNCPCPHQLRHLSGAFQTRTAPSSFAWFNRNNPYNTANARRNQRALRISTQ